MPSINQGLRPTWIPMATACLMAWNEWTEYSCSIRTVMAMDARMVSNFQSRVFNSPERTSATPFLEESANDQANSDLYRN